MKRRWASRSAAESFSETSATVRAECARSPFSVLTGVKLLEEALKRITDARQLAAWAAAKSSWKKYSRAVTPRERAQAGCRFHEPATGSGRSAAVSHLAPTALLQADAATGCEPSLFLVAQVRPLVLEKLIRNCRLVTTQSYQRNFLLFNSPFGGPTRLNVPRVTWPPLPREGEGEGDFRATRLRASTPHPDPLPFPRGEA